MRRIFIEWQGGERFREEGGVRVLGGEGEEGERERERG